MFLRVCGADHPVAAAVDVVDESYQRWMRDAVEKVGNEQSSPRCLDKTCNCTFDSK